MRQLVEQHHPPRLPPALSPPGVRDVHRFVAAVARVALRSDDRGAGAGVVRENAVAAPRRIFGAGECEEENPAEQNPPGVDKREVAIHRVMIRAA